MWEMFCGMSVYAKILEERLKREETMENKIIFRYAERKDVPLILVFIRKLAEHEKLPELVTATELLLEEWLFDKKCA